MDWKLLRPSENWRQRARRTHSITETRAGKPQAFMPDSYPHFTNGDEKQSERHQETFATRANLSKWFAIQEDHHGNGPDSHPGVPLPSRRSRWSSWQASVQSAGPPPQ